MAAWPLLRALLPHYESLADLCLASGDTPQALGRAQNQLALFLSAQGQYAWALELRESALAMAEATLGPNHPHTALRLDHLAETYRDLGRPDDALPLEERAEAIRQSKEQPDRADT